MYRIVIATFYYYDYIIDNVRRNSDMPPKKKMKKTSNKGESRTTCGETSRHHSKAKRSTSRSSSKPTKTASFEGSDFILPLLKPFMDVPSLVSFGAINKKNKVAFSAEVQRRKGRFQEIKTEIDELLKPTMPSRESVEKALGLRDEAARLVDAGLDWLDHECIVELLYEGGPCPICSCDPLFADERKQLKAHEGGDIAKNLLMLPTLFYVSKYEPFDGYEDPSDEDIAKAQALVLFLWGAEDHMGSVHEMTGFDEYYQDPEYPLRVFNHPLASFYDGLVHEIAANDVVRDGNLDAFRFAAREKVKAIPHSLPCLLFALASTERSLEKILAEDAGEGDFYSTIDDATDDLWWTPK
jgi:hypothetical protein